MAFTNFETKEINCKVAYFGPSEAGKSTTLRSIYTQTSAEMNAGLFELEERAPTPYFEFLPVSLGYVKDYHLKLHLYTLPRSDLYHSVAATILKGLDGWIFIADARVKALSDNIDALQRAKDILTREGFNTGTLPRVIQYNKMDMNELTPMEILRSTLNPGRVFECESIAKGGVGTLEALQLLAKQILDQLAPQVNKPRGPSHEQFQQ